MLKTKIRGINDSRMKIAQWVGAKAQDGKNALNHDYRILIH